jgi:hypothetical protein
LDKEDGQAAFDMMQVALCFKCQDTIPVSNILIAEYWSLNVTGEWLTALSSLPVS